jgi:transposase
MGSRRPQYDEFYGKTCPYHLACPHLQGNPAQRIWNTYQLLAQENHQLRQQLDQLRARVRELEDQNAQLQAGHRRQFKANVPDSATGVPRRRRKRGAPKGHRPWIRREPDRVDQTVSVGRPHTCPHCHTSPLAPLSQLHTHRQEDIVLVPRTVVTEYRHAQSWCPRCGRAVYQTGPGEMRQALIGPVAKATAAWLRYGIGISYRKVQRIFDQLFGLRFVPASAVGFDGQLTRRAADLYEDLRAKIKTAQTLHADETHWRVDGVNYFLWYVGNTRLSCFHIDRHRSGEVAVELLGDHYAGLLHTDDFAAYNLVHPQHRQSCLSHHLRTARELQQLLQKSPAPTGRTSPTLNSFLQPLERWIQRVCRARRQATQRDRPATSLKPRCRAWLHELDDICRPPLPEPEVETFRLRLLKDRDQLLAFVHHPSGQPTNNAAEQALRPSVILRKITFGNRSTSGARNHSLITSLIHTAAKQGASLRGVLEKILCDRPAQAQLALYPHAPDSS